jgi:hypothetical protein
MSSGDLRLAESSSQRSLAPLRSVWRTTEYFFWLRCLSFNAMFGPALLHFFLCMLANRGWTLARLLWSSQVARNSLLTSYNWAPSRLDRVDVMW